MDKENTKKSGDITPNDGLRDVSWEAEMNASLRQSLKERSLINIFFAIIIIALSIALVVLIPLKQVVPYVVRVDTLTGATSIGETVQDYVSDTELSNKHWVNKYVISRERYDYHLLQYDYDTVKSLSGDQTWQQYDELFEGSQALDRKYGKSVELNPKIISISLTETNGQKFATVRFSVEKRDLRAKSKQPASHKVATLRYEYKPQIFVSEQAAVANPFGFTVTSYKTDSEFVGDKQ